MRRYVAGLALFLTVAGSVEAQSPLQLPPPCTLSSGTCTFSGAVSVTNGLTVTGAPSGSAQTGAIINSEVTYNGATAAQNFRNRYFVDHVNYSGAGAGIVQPSFFSADFNGALTGTSGETQTMIVAYTNNTSSGTLSGEALEITGGNYGTAAPIGLTILYSNQSAGSIPGAYYGINQQFTNLNTTAGAVTSVIYYGCNGPQGAGSAPGHTWCLFNGSTSVDIATAGPMEIGTVQNRGGAILTVQGGGASQYSLIAAYASSDTTIRSYMSTNGQLTLGTVSFLSQTAMLTTKGLDTAAGTLNVQLTDSGATQRFAVYNGGDVMANSGAALATNATTGFFGLPTQAGIASGTPTNTNAGNALCVVDTTNGYLNCYYGGSWHKILFLAGAG